MSKLHCYKENNIHVNAILGVVKCPLDLILFFFFSSVWSSWRNPTMTWIDLSNKTDGYRFTTSQDTWMSAGSIFQSLFRLQMMLNFEFCCNFYLVLLELSRQSFVYSICWCSYCWHNSFHGIILLQFMKFYCSIQLRLYRIWRIHLEIFSICKLFFFS